MHLRIFLSSPGDVAEERTFAQHVVEQELPKDPSLRGKFTSEAFRWDDPNAPVAMPATLTPQEAVDRGLAKPSECDAVIVILWSRMGTPLPDTYRKLDGNLYLSGTEWEYEDAFSARPQPHILVYRRTAKPSWDFDDPDIEEKLLQRGRVKEFFTRFRNPDGSLRGGYAEYETPQEFRDRLRIDFRAFIERQLAEKRQNSDAARVKAPPPYRTIGKALSHGRVIPIIGAGAGYSGRVPNARWDTSAPSFLPGGIALSRLLADDSNFPSADHRDDLANVSSYYEAFQTRATLRERLRHILYADVLESLQLPALYHFLAEIPVPLLIVTTNYDTQLEQAFRAAGKQYDLVVYPADRKDFANAVLWWPHGAPDPRTPTPNELDIDLSVATVIFKMHGSIVPKNEEWDSFVITEEDHVQFLSRLSSKSAIPPLFSTHFQDRGLLFLGYSLRDWNLRVVFRSLSRYFGRRYEDEDEIPSWAIEDELSELEVKLWNKRGVYPYEVGIDEFVAKLRTSLAS